MKRFDRRCIARWMALAAGGLFTLPACGQGATNWLPRQALVSGEIYGVAYHQGQFVVAGDTGMAASPDGNAWTALDVGTNRWMQGVGVSSNGWVAVGLNGVVLSSPDGQTWTRRNSGTTEFLYDVAYGAGMFVAVGDVGTVRVSADHGLTWGGSSGAGSFYYDGVAWGDGRFVAVGYGGAVATSTNGTAWTIGIEGVTPTAEFLDDVVWGKGQFVAVGSGGTILTSTNGVSWVRRTSGTTLWLFGVGYGDGRFLAVGEQGTILSSADGLSWVSESHPTQQSLYAAANAGTGWVLSGGDGGVLVRDFGVVGDYRLENPRIMAGRFTADVSGIRAGERVLAEGLERVGSAVGWVPVATMDGTGGTMTFEDVTGATWPMRLYRVRKE